MPNIIFGFSVLFITALLGGMYLGGTFNDESVSGGNHLLSLARFYLREGHSHGNFLCLYNVLVGLVLANLALSEKWKKISSYSAMATILLPAGLFWKGLIGGIADPPPVAVIGILGFAVSLGAIIFGAWKSRA